MDSRSLLAGRDALDKASIESTVKTKAGGNRKTRRKDASDKKRKKRKKNRAFVRKQGKQQQMPGDIEGALSAIATGEPLEDLCGHGRYRGIACPWCLGINAPAISDEAKRLCKVTRKTAAECQEIIDACYDLEITAETLIDCEGQLQIEWHRLLAWHRRCIANKESGEEE